MKKWYFNLSIKYKLLLLFYLLLALFAAAFYFYNTRTSSDNIVHNVGSANLYLLQQMNADVAFLRREVEDMSAQLIVQPQIQEYTRPSGEHATETQKLYVDSSVRSAVNLIVSKDYISSLSIYGFENNAVPFLRSIDSRFSMPDMREFSQTEYFTRVTQAKGKPVWEENNEDTFLFAQNNRYNRIFMARMIREYNTYENLGILMVGISEPALRRKYTRGIDLENGSIAIYGQNGALLSSAGAMAFLEHADEYPASFFAQDSGFRIEKLEGERVLLSYLRDKSTGWFYLYSVPMQRLTWQINNSRNYIFLFVFAALVLFFPLVMFATGWIIRPLDKLLLAMRSFQTGDFGVKTAFRYEDEIGQLGDGFNEMVGNMQRLIDQVYVLQIREREAELDALQNQINPHFLYNTLDSIYWKAMKGGQPEVAEMVWTLSSLFRANLSRRGSWTSVGEEFDFLRQYLRLQQMRYGEKVAFSVSLQQGIERLRIPKLLLQPLVENAIYHGLEQKAEGGSVTVTGELAEDMLVFVVRDNGRGIDQPTLARLQSGDYTGGESGDGKAVRNIQERLLIVYGGEARFLISSKPDEGTRMEIRLPRQKAEEEGDDSAIDRG